MNDDFNTAEFIACLFDLLLVARKLEQHESNISTEVLNGTKSTYSGFLNDVLGIKSETNSESAKLPEVLSILTELRQEVRAKRGFELSDYIRERLAAVGIQINTVRNSREDCLSALSNRL